MVRAVETLAESKHPLNLRFRIIVLSLVRNCKKQVASFLAIEKELQDVGASVDFIFGENSSRDGTREILEQLAASKPNWTIIDTAEMLKYKHRLYRMAVGRELLLNALKAKGSHWDFVVVVDGDDVLRTTPSARVLLEECMRLYTNKELFGISASTDPYYYDLLALRIPGYFELNLMGPISTAKKKVWSYYKFMKDNVFLIQQEITKLHGLKCSSAFNGLCIYRYEDYVLSSYLPTHDIPVCEHVTFNEALFRRSRRWVEISNRLRLQTPEGHGPRSMFQMIAFNSIRLWQKLARFMLC